MSGGAITQSLHDFGWITKQIIPVGFIRILFQAISFLFLSFIFGCATAPTRIEGVTVTPSVIVPDYDPDDPFTVENVEPQEAEDTYMVTSPVVYAYLALSDFTGTRTLQWQWFDPSGKVYADTGPFLIGQEGHTYETAEAFHQISVNDEDAALRPGLWHVAAILDGETFKHPFTIIGPPPPEEALDVREEAPVVVLSSEGPSLPIPPLSVFFHVGKIKLTKEARAHLDQWHRALPASGQPITIAGHHDSTGSNRFNRWLAHKRAEVVKQYLVAQGVDPKMIRTAGKPFIYFTENATKEGRRENRRAMLMVE